MTKKVMAVLGALGLAICVSGSVHADNLVTNGDFTELSNGPGQLTTNTIATGWTTTNNGYNFVFTASTADTTGAPGQYGDVPLWGPGNGSANGFSASPDGTNFLADDGAFQVEPVTQTISGLTVGDDYDLTFYWAAAQQEAFTGATTDQWIVSLGSETQSTPVDSIPSEGFSGWAPQTFTYTATSNSEVLSFLANGTPVGEPPFALLGGVSLVETPEPSSLAAMFVGALCLGALIRRRVMAKKLGA